MLRHSKAVRGSSLSAVTVVFYLGTALATPALAIGGGTGGNAPSGGMGGSSPGSTGSVGPDTGGTGGGPGGERGTRSRTMPVCPRGQVWVQRTNRCMRTQSGLVPDAELTEYAYALARAKRYQEALDTLDQLKDQNTPRALNYRGYATRKLGRTDEGIGYYLKSVALDPKYPQVREYLGEAYVTQGKLNLAKEQLQTIKGLCGTGCEEYRDLAKAIASAPNL